MPVPAACGWPGPPEDPPPSAALLNDVVMSTTAGSTLFAMACTLRPVTAWPVDGVVCGTACRGGSDDRDDPGLPPRVSFQPMPTPALSNTSPARAAAST